MITVYISIGNSDDKLGQERWARFVADVDAHTTSLEDDREAVIHGRWLSAPDSPYQNACWCLQIHEDPHTGSRAGWLREVLASLAYTYEQDSIAWSEVKSTELLGPSHG